MERYAFPRIGNRPVSEVNTADVLEILTPIWHSKAETARAVRQRIRSVLEWAIALDMRNDNPCDRVLPVLGPQNDIVTHRQALPHKDVATAVETVRAESAQPAVKLAFEFLVLTATRAGDRDSRRGAEARRRRSARVPDAERKADIGINAGQDAPEPPGPGCAAQLSLVVPGLGGGNDRSSAGGHRGGAGPCRPEQGGGGLRAVGPVQAAAAAHGGLGGLPFFRTWKQYASWITYHRSCRRCFTILKVRKAGRALNTSISLALPRIDSISARRSFDMDPMITCLRTSSSENGVK